MAEDRVRLRDVSGISISDKLDNQYPPAHIYEGVAGGFLFIALTLDKINKPCYYLLNPIEEVGSEKFKAAAYGRSQAEVERSSRGVLHDGSLASDVGQR